MKLEWRNDKVIVATRHPFVSETNSRRTSRDRRIAAPSRPQPQCFRDGKLAGTTPIGRVPGCRDCIGRAPQTTPRGRNANRSTPRLGANARRTGAAVQRELRVGTGELAEPVLWEAGGITQENLGEDQEMIDIYDFAVRLSHQTFGSTIASERPATMQDSAPLGVL